MRTLYQSVVAGTLGLALAAGAVGCATDRHEDIPPAATLRVEGNERLSYSAPTDGMVYVYDVGRDRMVYSGAVDKDATVVVDPEKDLITIDGTSALEDGLDSGNQYRVFFMEQTEPDVDVSVQTTETRIETERRVD